MRFSVLTPSYNQGEFLEKNIASVRDQDAEGVEHIVVDGGSTDDTVDVLRRNASDLHYWVSEPDNGQADALNKALDRATAEIVGWLNVDEYYEPNVFGAVRDAFERNPKAVVVYGDFRRVTPDGHQIRVNRQWRFDYAVCRAQTPILMNCSTFFRRDALVACGGFDAAWQYIMDWELYVRLMRGNREWVRLRRVLGNFTMHVASKTARSQKGFGEEIRRLRDREFPGMAEAEFERLRRRQLRRMQWHMLLDGVLPEKVWFKLVTQRRYAEYFGSPGARLPVLSRIIDLLVPPGPGRGTP